MCGVRISGHYFRMHTDTLFFFVLTYGRYSLLTTRTAPSLLESQTRPR